MSLLLDTHVWIWSQETPEELGGRTSELLIDSEQALYVSPVSTLEIARLVATGTIRLSGGLLEWVTDTLEALRGITVQISHEIAAEAYSLPGPFHKNPADRILTATARLDHLTLVTADERLLKYPHVRTQNARN